MYKPDLLRAALTEAFPALADKPEDLQIWIDEGRLAARGVEAGAAAFEYRYRLNVVLLNFAGPEDLVMLVALSFIARHQVELLQDYARNDAAFTFDVEPLDSGAVDLQLQIQLTERVRATPRDGGGLDLESLPEPDPAEPHWTSQHWEVYLDGEKVGAWDLAT